MAGMVRSVNAAGSRPVQLSLTTPQADGLAAALNVWALAMIVPAKPNGRRIFLAALFFTLAWSAKVTTVVFGLAAALIWLLAVGRERAAWLLAAEILVRLPDRCRRNHSSQRSPRGGDLPRLCLGRS